MTTTKYIFAIIMHDKAHQEQSSQNDSCFCLLLDITPVLPVAAWNALPAKEPTHRELEFSVSPQQPQGKVYAPVPKLHSEFKGPTPRATDRCMIGLLKPIPVCGVSIYLYTFVVINRSLPYTKRWFSL